MKLLVFTFLLSSFTYSTSLEIKQLSTYNNNQVRLVTLPRKLRLTEDASNLRTRVLNSEEESHSYNHQGDFISGKQYKKAGIKDAKGVTWQDPKTQLFTMDYSNVRRRRPIHNKSINLGP